MGIVVTDPDGNEHTFADGTPEHVINAQMEQRWAGRNQPPAQSYMPPGTVAGHMNAQPGIEASMVPLSEDAQKWQRLLALKTMQGDRSGVTGAQALLNADPTYEARKKQSTDMGADAARRSEMKRTGVNILRSYAHLLDAYEDTPDDIIAGSTGARNTTKMPPSAVVPLSYESWRAPDMTPPQAQVSFGPFAGDAKYKSYWDAQNRFDHLIHGLTQSFMAGAGKGLNMSDTRQQAFEATMKDFLRSETRAKQREILNDAKIVIMNDFGLSPKDADEAIRSHLVELYARLPRPQTAEEAAALKTGTRFIAPDGTIKRAK